MEQASKVFYKIANVFNWITVVLGLIVIVFSILGGMGVNLGADVNNTLGWSNIGVGIWLVVLSVVLIILTRIAYKKGSSSGWDILFLVLGLLDGNLFYVLGGLFGLLAKK
jgi:hypothetical protein